MEIKIFGAGYAKCKSTKKLTREVVALNEIEPTITKMEDITEIIKYHIMATPASVLNEKVEIRRCVPSASRIKEVLA
jgi:small redox-active disulfide protein 2